MRFLLLFIILFSCKEKKQEPFDPEKVKVEYKEYRKDDNSKKIDIELNLKYPVFISDFAYAIIEPLNDRVKENLFKFDNKNYGFSDVDSFYFLIENKYKEILKKYPDYSEPWRLKRQISVSGFNEKRISIHTFIKESTGGENEVELNYFRHFNTLDGRLIQLEEILIDSKIDDFKKLLETKFRYLRKIPSNMTLSEAGFFYDSNKLYLNNNYQLDNRNFTILYNAAEIADFSEGSIEIKLNYDEFSFYADKEYLSLFK